MSAIESRKRPRESARAFMWASIAGLLACTSSPAGTQPSVRDREVIGAEDACFAARGADRRRCIDFGEPNAWAFDAACLDVEAHGPLAPGWPYVTGADGARVPRPNFIADCRSASPQPGELAPTTICCP